MPNPRLFRIWSAAVLACTIVLPGHSQAPRKLNQLVINANRPFVYLKFDHMGKGIQRSDNEPEMRVWFRFVNNCNVPVNLRAFGVPEGSPAEEVGIMDEVVEDSHIMDVIRTEPEPASSNWSELESTSSPTQPEPAAKPESNKKPKSVPHGYWFDLGVLLGVRPGQEILFSIPVNQLTKGWHVQIPFSFEVPEGTVARDPINGGQPEMYLSYSIYELPNKVQAEITDLLKN